MNNIQTSKLQTQTFAVLTPLRRGRESQEIVALTNVNQTKTSARRYRRRAFIPASLLCIGGIFFGHRHVTVTTARAEFERRQRIALAALRKQAWSGVEMAGKADFAALHPHRAALAKSLDEAHASGLSAVPAASEELGGFWNCAGMIARLAQDLVQGGNSASQHLAACLPGVMSAATQMQGATHAALGSMRHETLGRTHALCAELLLSVRALPFDVQGVSLVQPLTAMIGTVQQQQIEQGATAALLPWDILWTAAATRELFARLLMPYARRAAAMLGANVALIAADGPMPFGDVMALLGDIGFGLWTAWDIFWLSRDLPGQIAATLREGIDATHKLALDSFDELSTQIIKGANHQRRHAVQPVLALDPAAASIQNITAL